MFVLLGGLISLAEAAEQIPVSRYIQYTFTLKNTSPKVVEQADFWAYAPVKETSTQRCIDIRASHPFTLEMDELGNQILHFRFDQLPPFATKMIRVEADVELRDIPLPRKIEKRNWLAPEQNMDFSDVEFRRLAPRFSSIDSADRISETFNWVSQNIRDEGYVSDDLGALHALKYRRGDCSEFMFLFAALCRQQGIPSRGVEGYVAERDAVLHPAGYHSWAEVHDGLSWKLADPLEKVFDEQASRYIAMRIVGDVPSPLRGVHRFRAEGDGIKVVMNTE